MKFARGYAVVWFEELDQFDGIDAVRSILNSLRRGGEDLWIFYSYNPPRTMWSWVNLEKPERERRADTLARSSSCLDVIESHSGWLGASFVEGAEYLRDVDEAAWRSKYPGDVTGTGGAPSTTWWRGGCPTRRSGRSSGCAPAWTGGGSQTRGGWCDAPGCPRGGVDLSVYDALPKGEVA